MKTKVQQTYSCLKICLCLLGCQNTTLLEKCLVLFIKIKVVQNVNRISDRNQYPNIPGELGKLRKLRNLGQLGERLGHLGK